MITLQPAHIYIVRDHGGMAMIAHNVGVRWMFWKNKEVSTVFGSTKMIDYTNEQVSSCEMLISF